MASFVVHPSSCCFLDAPNFATKSHKNCSKVGETSADSVACAGIRHAAENIVSAWQDSTAVAAADLPNSGLCFSS